MNYLKTIIYNINEIGAYKQSNTIHYIFPNTTFPNSTIPPLITRVTIHVHVSPVLSRDVCPFTVGQRPPPNRQKWRQASGTVEFRGPKQITNIASPVHVKITLLN